MRTWMGSKQGGKAVVEKSNSGNNGHNNKPEPEEHVNLLVDKFEGEYAETLVWHNVTTRTVLVEGALGNLG